MRTKKSIYNALSVSISYVLRIILAFGTKTVLINTLGDEYNGIDGLFTSIISKLTYMYSYFQEIKNSSIINKLPSPGFLKNILKA